MRKDTTAPLAEGFLPDVGQRICDDDVRRRLHWSVGDSSTDTPVSTGAGIRTQSLLPRAQSAAHR
jgi:hypothetical protein